MAKSLKFGLDNADNCDIIKDVSPLSTKTQKGTIMQMTKEYEAEQLDLAIRYYEEKLERAWSWMEALKIEETIKSLSSRLKEIQSVQKRRVHKASRDST